MKTYGLFTLFILAFLCSCESEIAGDGRLTRVKTLNYYPSGSALEFIDGRFYLMGDDARYLLVLNDNLVGVDSLVLFPGTGARVPKEIKADLESVSSYSFGQEDAFVLTGSGSLAPYRENVWWITNDLQQSDSIRDDAIYARIRTLGVQDINFEGTTEMNSEWLMGNRGNTTHPKNFLIVMEPPFHRTPDSLDIHVAEINLIPDTSFAGLSGLDYSKENDRLYLTFSIEKTNSSTGDGEIGKSFLCIIENMSTKLTAGTLALDRIVDLQEMDSRFVGHKVESVTIISEDDDIAELALVSDKDDGKSTLFLLDLKL